MEIAGKLIVEGQEHALERIERVDAGSLRLVSVEDLPLLRDRVCYVLAHERSREPVQLGQVLGPRAVRVRTWY